MEKRDFDEMVSYFMDKVLGMDIEQKYRMELLGMVTAIQMEHHALMSWIPVTEALPEEDEEVLVTVRFDGTKDVKPSVYVETASQISGSWFSYSDEWKVSQNRHHVIAWMPLPEGYRGE